MGTSETDAEINGVIADQEGGSTQRETPCLLISRILVALINGTLNRVNPVNG
jgi:hypothetical protein